MSSIHLRLVAFLRGNVTLSVVATAVLAVMAVAVSACQGGAAGVSADGPDLVRALPQGPDAVWHGKIYVDPANIVYEGEPSPLPSVLTHERAESAKGTGVQDAEEAARCFVDDSGEVVICWPVIRRSASEAEQSPIVIAFVMGLLANWVWQVIQPGWWDSQLIEFVTGHCEARGLATRLTIDNGSLAGWECVSLQ